MDIVRRSANQLVVIYFTDGAARELQENSSVTLYDTGLVKVVAGGLEDYYLPHAVRRVVFPERKAGRARAVSA